MPASDHVFPILVASSFNGTRYFICDAVAQYGQWRRTSLTLQENGPEVKKHETLQSLEPPPASTLSDIGSGAMDACSLLPLTAQKPFVLDKDRSASFTIFECGVAAFPGYLFYNIIYPSKKLPFIKLQTWRSPSVSQLFHRIIPIFLSRYSRAFSRRPFSWMGARRRGRGGQPQPPPPAHLHHGKGNANGNQHGGGTGGAGGGGRWLGPLALSIWDCLTQTGFLYFPLYYTAREYIYERRAIFPDWRGFRNAVFGKWRQNFRRDVSVNVSVWVPIMFVAFRYVPRTYLWPYMSASGVVWAFVLNWLQFGSFL